MKQQLMSTKEVAQFLHVNEKMVYSLIAEKGLPATKVTGKWLFPAHLVEQWVEMRTTNYPEASAQLSPYRGVLVIAGSNDLLLERMISNFNLKFPEQMAVFGNVGSMGGLKALQKGLCQIAACHLVQSDGQEYNFNYAQQELEAPPVLVNFCRRQQGFMVARGNPHAISSIESLKEGKRKFVNRPEGTGTRLLFDRELAKAGIEAASIAGYQDELPRHVDVGLAVLSGRADAGLGIRTVAIMLGLDFIPLCWERYDLLILRERFFERGVQMFLESLQKPTMYQFAEQLGGYDAGHSGRMMFPPE